jgi:hypothetical protein
MKKAPDILQFRDHAIDLDHGRRRYPLDQRAEVFDAVLGMKIGMTPHGHVATHEFTDLALEFAGGIPVFHNSLFDGRHW